MMQPNKDDSLIYEPAHYNSHASGVECRSVTEHLNSNLANAFKYVFRHQLKGKPIQDVEKSLVYLSWEKANLEQDSDDSRVIFQQPQLDDLKANLKAIYNFEPLARLKSFYKNFYLVIANRNFALKHLDDCTVELQLYLDYLNRNA